MSQQEKLIRLNKLRLILMKREGYFAKLRREVEKEITQEHVKSLLEECARFPPTP